MNLSHAHIFIQVTTRGVDPVTPYQPYFTLVYLSIPIARPTSHRAAHSEQNIRRRQTIPYHSPSPDLHRPNQSIHLFPPSKNPSDNPPPPFILPPKCLLKPDSTTSSSSPTPASSTPRENAPFLPPRDATPRALRALQAARSVRRPCLAYGLKGLVVRAPEARVGAVRAPTLRF